MWKECKNVVYQFKHLNGSTKSICIYCVAYQLTDQHVNNQIENYTS